MYRRRRDVREFLNSNTVINHSQFFRAFAVGLVDIIFTLPSGIIFLVSNILYALEFSPTHKIPFYPGWYRTHHPWAPVFVPKSSWDSLFWQSFQIYYQLFQYPLFSLIIFLLFGLTPTARGQYRRWFWATARLIGVKPPRTRDGHSALVLGPPPRRSANATRCAYLIPESLVSILMMA